jgi:hypothetical protein
MTRLIVSRPTLSLRSLISNRRSEGLHSSPTKEVSVQALQTKLVTAAAVLGAAIGGGAIANAATTNSSTASSSQSGAATQRSHPSYPAHGTAAHESLEKPVTGTSSASKAQAAALKAVGSGKAGDVTTDASGNGYEVVVTKSDGSKVEVHLNGSFGLDDHGHLGG